MPYNSEDELSRAFAEGQLASRFWPDASWWQPSEWDLIIQSKIHEQDRPSKMLAWLATAQPALALELIQKYFQNVDTSEAQKIILEVSRLQTLNENILARATAYRVLGELNADTRFGIQIPTSRGEPLPEFAWIDIPAGHFLSGDQKEKRWSNAMRIAAYPLTNAQYNLFIQANGYSTECYWTQAGWRWQQTYEITKAYSPDLSLEISNYPRIGISWYEATAYTRWLNELYADHKIPYKVRLPSEFELERAIRGDTGNRFAYGDQVDYTRCNGGNTGLGCICPVGIFPEGRSPHGLYDGTGNVWEWTLSTPNNEWGGNVDSGESRVIRSGSWNYFGNYLRCAFRYWYAPVSRNAIISVRLAASDH